MIWPVTVKPKCYVFKCLGCGEIAQAERSDTLTCSNACRVRAHRMGTVKRKMRDAISAGIAAPGDRNPRQAAAFMVRADAVMDLCPDLLPQIDAGAASFDDLQPEANRRYLDRIRQMFADLREARA